jgi:hypothetical protein
MESSQIWAWFKLEIAFPSTTIISVTSSCYAALMCHLSYFLPLSFDARPKEPQSTCAKKASDETRILTGFKIISNSWAVYILLVQWIHVIYYLISEFLYELTIRRGEKTNISTMLTVLKMRLRIPTLRVIFFSLCGIILVSQFYLQTQLMDVQIYTAYHVCHHQDLM